MRGQKQNLTSTNFAPNSELIRNAMFLRALQIIALCLFASFLDALLPSVTHAQIDPSSALLLNGSARSNSRDNGLDSGRYTVRPRSETTRTRSSDETSSRSRLRTVDAGASNPAANASPVAPSTNQTTNSGANSAVNPAPSAPSTSSQNASTQLSNNGVRAEVQATSTLTTNSTSTPTSAQGAPAANTPAGVAPGVESSNQPVKVVPVESTSAATATTPATVKVAPEVREDEAIREQAERNQAEAPKAPQNNLLDISFAAGYLYNDSSSGYSFRKYSTSSPSVSAEARVWVSPEFGIGGSYQTTLGGSLPDGSNPSRVVSSQQQTMTLGIRYRDFFTRDLTYPYLIWGADYYQYHLSVPQDSEMRADLSTTGVKLSVMGVFPSRRSYAWNLGFALLPKMYHHEGSNAAGFKSGGHADSNAVEFLVGGQWQLSSSSSMFWRVNYQIEKDLFSGDASVADPSNNTTPHGVSVTNSSVLLQMGYGWGN